METLIVKNGIKRATPAGADSWRNKVLMVRCAYFRCLAYRDRNGVWRTLFGNRLLPEILEVCA